MATDQPDAMTHPSLLQWAHRTRLNQLVYRYRDLSRTNSPVVVRQTMLLELSRRPVWWNPLRRKHVAQYALLLTAVERLAQLDQAEQVEW